MGSSRLSAVRQGISSLCDFTGSAQDGRCVVTISSSTIFATTIGPFSLHTLPYYIIGTYVCSALLTNPSLNHQHFPTPLKIPQKPDVNSSIIAPHFDAPSFTHIRPLPSDPLRIVALSQQISSEVNVQDQNCLSLHPQWDQDGVGGSLSKRRDFLSPNSFSRVASHN